MAGLKGKTGIVTGGSSGIGFQIANVLAQAGAIVYVISRNISDFSSLIEELERETIFDGVPARRQEKGQALLHKL